MGYLYATRYIAVRFNGKNPSPDLPRGPNVPDIPRSSKTTVTAHFSSDLRIASDASSADDQISQKSSQKSIQKSILSPFSGPISWKAEKHNTVTTLSTEAELLAFIHTGMEALATQRLFKQLGLQRDQQLEIECNNQQTIRLATLETPGLRLPSGTLTFTAAGLDRDT